MIENILNALAPVIVIVTGLVLGWLIYITIRRALWASFDQGPEIRRWGLTIDVKGIRVNENQLPEGPVIDVQGTVIDDNV